MRWLSLILLLAACDSPSLWFHDRPALRVAVDGTVFHVRLRGERAESLRIGPGVPMPREKVLATARVAIGRASGCTVLQIDGDEAIQRATLDCPGQGGTPLPLDTVFVVLPG